MQWTIESLFFWKIGTKRMKNIALMTRTVHLYVLHPLSQPNIIEESIIFLEYDFVGPNDKNGEVTCVEEGNIELGKNSV